MSKKPSELEAEYIARMEYEKKKKLEEEKHRNSPPRRREIEGTSQHEMSEMRHGTHRDRIQKIRVDKCSECEGIWLDPGELMR